MVCVGSIYPRKRQTDLVRAVHMLTGTPVECVLVGPWECWIRPAMKSCAAIANGSW